MLIEPGEFRGFRCRVSPSSGVCVEKDCRGFLGVWLRTMYGRHTWTELPPWVWTLCETGDRDAVLWYLQRSGGYTPQPMGDPLTLVSRVAIIEGNHEDSNG